MLMFFNEGLGGLPGFRFEFETINRSGIIFVFIKSVAEFVEGLEGEIGKRRVIKEGGLVEIDHFRITKREAGFEMKMIIGILEAQKIEKLLLFMINLAFHKFIVILVGEKIKQKRRWVTLYKQR